MIAIDNEQFEKLLNQAYDELKQSNNFTLDNVVVTYDELPTYEQLRKGNVAAGHTLLGLYEGIPKTRRGAGYHMILPDKITLFKQPLLSISQTLTDLQENVKRTLWHEIAHHYGLDHNRIHKLENH